MTSEFKELTSTRSNRTGWGESPKDMVRLWAI